MTTESKIPRRKTLAELTDDDAKKLGFKGSNGCDTCGRLDIPRWEDDSGLPPSFCIRCVVIKHRNILMFEFFLMLILALCFIPIGFFLEALSILLLILLVSVISMIPLGENRARYNRWKNTPVSEIIDDHCVINANSERS